MCPADVLGDCHSVVRLEYFARGEPCVFGVLLNQLALVIIKADELFEIDGRLELANLVVLGLIAWYLFCRNNPTWDGKACRI
jgi:hypothetical protein